mgnify:CR=1 FL=1
MAFSVAVFLVHVEVEAAGEVVPPGGDHHGPAADRTVFNQLLLIAHRALEEHLVGLAAAGADVRVIHAARQPSLPAASSGMRLRLRATQVAKSCSSGFSCRATSTLRALQYASAKSRLNWNMLPRSAAPGKPSWR